MQVVWFWCSWKKSVVNEKAHARGTSFGVESACPSFVWCIQVLVTARPWPIVTELPVRCYWIVSWPYGLTVLMSSDRARKASCVVERHFWLKTKEEKGGNETLSNGRMERPASKSTQGNVQKKKCSRIYPVEVRVQCKAAAQLNTRNEKAEAVKKRERGKKHDDAKQTTKRH